jgi:hypothetical protein
MRHGGWFRLSDHCGLRLCQCWAFRVRDWPGCGRGGPPNAREPMHTVLRDSRGDSVRRVVGCAHCELRLAVPDRASANDISAGRGPELVDVNRLSAPTSGTIRRYSPRRAGLFAEIVGRGSRLDFSRLAEAHAAARLLTETLWSITCPVTVCGMLRRYPVLGAVPAGQALAGYQRWRI